MSTNKNSRTLYTIFLNCISYSLLLEWIYPLKQIANTGTTLFIVFIGLSFILYLINLPKWINIAIKVVYILLSLKFLFYDVSFFQVKWFFDLLHDISVNFKWLFLGKIVLLTSPFRSLLFFILLWLITYLLRYWLTIRKSILLFFVMTIIYICVLDTFTPFYGSHAIIRSVIFGFSLLGLLFFQRFMDREQIINSNKLMAKWIIPLSIMVLFCTLFAYIAPKAAPVWPDPVPYLKGYGKGVSKNGKGSGISQVGYRVDDSKLGGPFIGNDEEIFTVEAKSRQYWRIETKDYYTGKGWTTSSDQVSTNIFQPEEPINLSISVPKSSDKREFQASIKMTEASSFLVYPYGLNKINPSDNKNDILSVDEATEKIRIVHNSKKQKVSKYSSTYQVPEYSVKAMSEPYKNGYEPDPRYTQLPDTLPDRVRQLAEEMTKDKTNQYDKTKAIEAYFSSGQFTYAQTNVAVPAEEQDYVDQFLFETKRGYCDNFSTSMVALLRAVGIPSRWVKGFSTGDYVEAVDSTTNKYSIKNNDAHSWVEVYFPEAGWVPFEPTIGFINTAVFNNDVKNNSSAGNNEQNDIRNRDEMEKQDEQKSQTESQSVQSNRFSFHDVWDNMVNYLKTHWLFVVLIGIVFVLIFAWIFSKRNKWIPFVLVWRYRFKKKPDTFSKAYLLLLKQLGRYGLKKEESQTLRDFANDVDNYFDTTIMRELTDHYERNIYRGQEAKNEWENNRELWENLIKKTTG